MENKHTKYSIGDEIHWYYAKDEVKGEIINIEPNGNDYLYEILEDGCVTRFVFESEIKQLNGE